MNYWIISDTHFNHTKLEQWGGRSGDWQLNLWDGLFKIPKEDILIHLGDICIGEDEVIHQNITALKCKKILVKGNHDNKSNKWYMEHGWDFVCDSFELIFHGHYIHFTHKPAIQQGHNTVNIHGHTHGTLHPSEDYVHSYDRSYNKDISPEIVGFKPLRLDTFIKSFQHENTYTKQ